MNFVYSRKTFIIITDLGIPSNIINWYSKAYENVTDVVERQLLCDKMYFTVYLVWMNFIVKFVVPTTILIVCNVKILLEVHLTYYFDKHVCLSIRGSVTKIFFA